MINLHKAPENDIGLSSPHASFIPPACIFVLLFKFSFFMFVRMKIVPLGIINIVFAIRRCFFVS